MFKLLNKQGVESDKGFVVQCTGRFTYEYCEKDKKIVIKIFDIGENPETHKFVLNVKADNFEKWIDGTDIPKGKQKEIKDNFVKAIEFLNMEVDIDDTQSLTAEEIRKQLDL